MIIHARNPTLLASRGKRLDEALSKPAKAMQWLTYHQLLNIGLLTAPYGKLNRPSNWFSGWFLFHF